MAIYDLQITNNIVFDKITIFELVVQSKFDDDDVYDLAINKEQTFKFTYSCSIPNCKLAFYTLEGSYSCLQNVNLIFGHENIAKNNYYLINNKTITLDANEDLNITNNITLDTTSSLFKKTDAGKNNKQLQLLLINEKYIRDKYLQKINKNPPTSLLEEKIDTLLHNNYYKNIEDNLSNTLIEWNDNNTNISLVTCIKLRIDKNKASIIKIVNYTKKLQYMNIYLNYIKKITIIKKEYYDNTNNKIILAENKH